MINYFSTPVVFLVLLLVVVETLSLIWFILTRAFKLKPEISAETQSTENDWVER